MPRKDVDLVKYLEEITKEAGLTPEQFEAAKLALSNEKVAGRLADDILQKRDYSRQTQELATKEKKIDEDYARLVSMAQENQRIFDQTLAENAGLKAKVSTYETQYGAPVDQPKPFDTSNFMTREEATKLASEVQNYNLAAASRLARIATAHLREFGEELDTDALYTQALKDNISLDDAHKRLVEPRREDLRQKDFEKKLTAAREEGAREARSKLQLPPTPTSHGEIHPLDAYKQMGEKLNRPAWERGVEKYNSGAYEAENLRPEATG